MKLIEFLSASLLVLVVVLVQYIHINKANADSQLEKVSVNLKLLNRNNLSESDRYALKAYRTGRALGLTTSSLLIIVDFSKSILEKRFKIIDVTTGEILVNTYTSHGSGSGRSLYVQTVSNQDGSKASSEGLMLTSGHYNGHNGVSIRVRGLEEGINSNAYRRFIEIHGASYIGHGRTGLSWGCFAIPSDVMPYVNQILGNKKILIFVYFNDRLYLRNSRFLK
jgi:hypothetical protein